MEKLHRVIRFDSIPAQDIGVDEQGFLHDIPIVTSTGIFEYKKPDGSVRRELRLPEYVFSEESLASYEGKPIIITHNAGSIDKENVMNEIVGTILSKGYQDGDNVRCKVVIHDIDKVKKTPFRELSLGYTQDLIEEPGVWNGQPYDAIQTNIQINHLAIVENARAGEKAHLNLDSKNAEVDDNKNLGGNGMNDNSVRTDGFDMTPEELCEAIKQYKASKTAEGVNAAPAEPVKDAPGKEAQKENMGDGAETGIPAAPAEQPADDRFGKIIPLLESLIAELKGEKTDSDDVSNGQGDQNEQTAALSQDGTDCSGSQSQAMNMDSLDDTISQKLNICRIGDKLNLDGLEQKSILECKKTIIAKVLPEMRLDGKDEAYINAAYDIAVSETQKRKGVDYQRQQMTGGASAQRFDGIGNVSMADASRKSMIERNGGNE